MESQIKSQEFGIGNLLSEGWRIYRANFTNILMVVLCVYIPVNIIISFIPVNYIISNYGTRGIQLINDILKILESFVGAIATIGIASIVENTLQGTTLSWSDYLLYGLSKWSTAIGTGFLAGLILLGLTLLLIIPGVIWSIYYSFWIYVIALRNIDGKTALDYSKSLVEGHWWQVFGILFVLGIIGSIVGLAVSIPLNMISENQFFGIIPNTIVDIVSAYFTVVTVIFFLNNDYRIKPALVEQSLLSPSKTEL
jgi:hypothetical protein